MSSGHLHPQYNLRWPNELRDKISQSAKEHNRSMNADIVARLEASFNDTVQFKEVSAVYDDLIQKILINLMTNLAAKGIDSTVVTRAIVDATNASKLE